MTRQFANAVKKTLGTAMLVGDTTITLPDSTGVPSSFPFDIHVEAEGGNTDEIMQATGLSSGTTYVVTRASEAYGGAQSASAHGIGATVWIGIITTGALDEKSVATDPIWTAAGDLAVGTGSSTAAKLGIGAAGGAVSRVNGAVAWNSGTSFPTAAAGDRYWRTDLGLEFWYDGTRWLSTEIFSAGTVTGTMLSATGEYARILLPTNLAVWLVSLYTYDSVSTTNDSTNYWNLYLSGLVTSTMYGQTTTSADSPNVGVGHSVALNVAAGATEKAVGFNGWKQGSPGNVNVYGLLTYRLIGA